MSAALERFKQNIDEAQGARQALDDRSEGADRTAADISGALQQDLQSTRAVLLTWTTLCMSCERACLAVHPEVA